MERFGILFGDGSSVRVARAFVNRSPYNVPIESIPLWPKNT